MRKQLIALGLILITSFIGYTVDSRGGANADELIKEQMAPFINTEGEVTAYGNNSILRIYDDTLANESNAVPLTVADNHLKTEQYFVIFNPWSTSFSKIISGYSDLKFVAKLPRRCLNDKSTCITSERDYESTKVPFAPVFTLAANDKYESIINAPTNSKKRARLADKLGSFFYRPNRLSDRRILARGYLSTVKNRPDLTVFVVTDLTDRLNIISKINDKSYNAVGVHTLGKLTQKGSDYYLAPNQAPNLNYRLVFHDIANENSRIGSSVKKLLDENIDKVVDISEGNLADFDNYSVWLPNDLNEPIIRNVDIPSTFINNAWYRSEEYKIDLEKNKVTFVDILSGLTNTLNLEGQDVRFRLSEPDRDKSTVAINDDQVKATGCSERAANVVLTQECTLAIVTDAQSQIIELTLTVRPWISINSPKDCQTNYPQDYLLVKHDQENPRDPRLFPEFSKKLFSVDPSIKDLVRFDVKNNASLPFEASRSYNLERSDYLARSSGVNDIYYRPIINLVGDGWKKFPEYICSDKNSFARNRLINLPSPEELARFTGPLDFSIAYGLEYDHDQPVDDPKPDFRTQPGEEITLSPPCETLSYSFSQPIELSRRSDKVYSGAIALDIVNSYSDEIKLDVEIISPYTPGTLPGPVIEALESTDLSVNSRLDRIPSELNPRYREIYYLYSGLKILPKESRKIRFGTFRFRDPETGWRPLIRILNTSHNKKCRKDLAIPYKIATAPTPPSPNTSPTPTAPVVSSVPTLPCANLDFKVRTVYINKKGGYAANIVLEIENKATVATAANLSTIGLAYDVNESQYATKYAITKLNSTTLPSPKVTEAVKYEPLVKADIKRQTHEFANVNIPANAKTLISLGNFTFNDRAPGLVGFYKNLKLDYLTARMSNYSWNKDCVKDVPVVILFGTDPNPVPTPVPTNTATPKPTATATPVPTATATPKPTATATPKPSPSATPTPTIVSKPNPSNRPSPTATATTAPTPVPTNTIKPTPTATASTRPTNTNSPRPTVSATPKQTPTPTPKPSNSVGNLIRNTVNNLLNRIFGVNR